MNIWTKEVSPTQGKMGRQVCRVLLSLSNVSAHKRQDDEKWSTFCPDPIPFFIPCVAREGKIRERTWMEPKRMNLVGSTSGQYHGCWNFWFSGIFFAELMNGSKLDVMMDQAMHMTIGTIALDSFTSSTWVHFDRFMPVNSCHPEGLIRLTEMLWKPIPIQV